VRAVDLPVGNSRHHNFNRQLSAMPLATAILWSPAPVVALTGPGVCWRVLTVNWLSTSAGIGAR